MAKVRKIITEESEKEKEEAERKKRLGRAKVSDAPATRYEHTTVDRIVSRMKKRYEDRGFGKEKGKGAELKKMVSGRKAISLDQREPAELRESKRPFPKFVGTIFSILGFLNIFAKRIENYRVAQSLQFHLDRANMNYSPRQFAAMALVAAAFISALGGLLSFALLFSLYHPTLLELVTGSALGASLAGMEMAAAIIIELLVAAIAGFLFFILSIFVSMQWPSNTAARRAKAIDKELPFALRHMATEVRAGVGIHKTMQSLVAAGYGELSVEFERTLRDIDKGMGTEDALIALSERSPSENLGKAVMHIVRALKTGGNLSEIIETIAAEVAFELRMKMRDFVERLNLIGLFYMMVGIVFPVFVAVLAGIFNAIPTIGLAGMLGTEVLFLIYFILIPMALSLIIYIIKVMQPM